VVDVTVSACACVVAVVAVVVVALHVSSPLSVELKLETLEQRAEVLRLNTPLTGEMPAAFGQLAKLRE
jgi:hypothetical protein